MSRITVALGTIFAAVLFLLLGCGPGESQEDQDGERLKSVGVMTVERVSLQRERSFAGTARAAETVPLSFEAEGKVSSLRVEMGQRVEPGDVVARLNCTDYRLQVQRRESGVDRAQAVLDRARSDYRRIRDLYKGDHASRSELDRALAEFRSAQASLREAEKALELAREKVADCTLTTGSAGLISQAPVEEQQNVRAGQTVAVLSKVDSMQLRVFLPEEVVTRIRPGDRAEASFPKLTEETLSARVREVGVEAARSTTYPVRLDLESAPQGLRPGMVGRAVFRFPAPPGIVLPARAVLGREGDMAWVFVLDPETHRVRKRSVEVGWLSEQGLVLQGGLEEGERVVVRGMSRLERGQKVTVQGDGR